MVKVVGVIMAGGEGGRLKPLTEPRAKPGVAFAGNYKIIDFVISNFINSGIFNLKIITQYKPKSLNRHINKFARIFFGSEGPSKLETMYEGLSENHQWYEGTADSVYKNLDTILSETDSDEKNIIDVFAGDHIYRMDIRQMNEFHLENNADLTVAGVLVPYKKAVNDLGVAKVDEQNRIIGWKEKPNECEIKDYVLIPESVVDNNGNLILEEVQKLKNQPISVLGKMVALSKLAVVNHELVLNENLGFVYASMGNYAWDSDSLENALRTSQGIRKGIDFGKEIIPAAIKDQKVNVFIYNFMDNDVKGVPIEKRGQWWDVGQLIDYYNVQMSLLDIKPEFNLYNNDFPLRSPYNLQPPSKINTGNNSYMICDGAVVTNAVIQRSIIGPGTQVENHAEIINTIIFGRDHMQASNREKPIRTQIGSGVRIKNAIIDRDVVIPDGWEIGYNNELDQSRGFTYKDGITIVPKGFNGYTYGANTFN